MSEFYLYLNQGGEGCDYTIGCGQRTRKLKATDWQSAVGESGRLIEEEYSFEERQVETVLLIESTRSAELPVADYYAALKAKRDAALQAEREKRERAELERLQSKYR